MEIRGGSARSVLDSFLPAKNRLWLRDTIRGKEENRDGDADKGRRGQKGKEMGPIAYGATRGDPSFYHDKDCVVISKKGYGRNGLNDDNVAGGERRAYRMHCGTIDRVTLSRVTK